MNRQTTLENLQRIEAQAMTAETEGYLEVIRSAIFWLATEPPEEEAIKLGQKVKDRITGYTGIAVGRTHYLQGCDRVLVQPAVTKEEPEKIPDGTSFDEPDLVVVGRGILPAPAKKKKPPGGPRPIATKRQ